MNVLMGDMLKGSIWHSPPVVMRTCSEKLARSNGSEDVSGKTDPEVHPKPEYRLRCNSTWHRTNQVLCRLLPLTAPW